MSIRTLIALSAIFFGIAGASVAVAQSLNFATVYPPGSTADQLTKIYAEKVSNYTNGEITIKTYPLSLLSAGEASDGVRDGIADISYIITAYTPSIHPRSNFMNESAFQLQLFDPELINNGKDAMAYNAALSEFILFNCPECLDEYTQQNQVFTGNLTSSRYGLLCTKPVKSVQDMKGLKVRVGGSHWSRWVNTLGGDTLSLTINENLEALDQGIVDCTHLSGPELINLNLWEVVTDITMGVGGVYSGGSATTINADVWRDLPLKHREALLRAGGDLSTAITYTYTQLEKDAIERTLDNGATLHEADASLLEATREFARADQKKTVNYYSEKYNIKQAQEMLDTFQPILEKWINLVQNVDSLETMKKLQWEEVTSKIDANTYGM